MSIIWLTIMHSTLLLFNLYACILLILCLSNKHEGNNTSRHSSRALARGSDGSAMDAPKTAKLCTLKVIEPIEDTQGTSSEKIEELQKIETKPPTKNADMQPKRPTSKRKSNTLAKTAANNLGEGVDELTQRSRRSNRSKKVRVINTEKTNGRQNILAKPSAKDVSMLSKESCEKVKVKMSIAISTIKLDEKMAEPTQCSERAELKRHKAHNGVSKTKSGNNVENVIQKPKPRGSGEKPESKTTLAGAGGKTGTKNKKRDRTEKIGSKTKIGRSAEKSGAKIKTRRSAEKAGTKTKTRSTTDKTTPPKKTERSAEKAGTKTKTRSTTHKTAPSKKRERSAEKAGTKTKTRSTADKTAPPKKIEGKDEKTGLKTKTGNIAKNVGSKTKTSRTAEKIVSKTKIGNSAEKNRLKARTSSTEKTGSKTKTRSQQNINKKEDNLKDKIFQTQLQNTQEADNDKVTEGGAYYPDLGQDDTTVDAPSLNLETHPASKEP